MQRQHHRASQIITAEDVASGPISIKHSSTMYDAIEKIMDSNISAVLIRASLEHFILTQREISGVLLTSANNVKDVPVTEAMRKCITIDRFAPISNCADVMIKQRTNALCIRDGNRITGILTKHDLVKKYYQSYEEKTKISEIMSVGSFFVREDMPLYNALQKMQENQISRLLVKDAHDKPVGITTFKNFLSHTVYQSNKDESDVFLTGFGRRVRVGHIMTPNVITVPSTTTIPRAAKVLIEYRIHGVAVTHGQRIVGFITEKDIVRHVAEIGI